MNGIIIRTYKIVYNLFANLLTIGYITFSFGELGMPEQAIYYNVIFPR